MNFIDFTNVLADHVETLSKASEGLNALAEPVNTTSGITDTGLLNLGKGIGAGLAMIGCIGVGAGEGITAAAAASAVGRNPEAQPKIMNIMIVGMAITESVSIYALIVSILLIFVLK